MSQAERWIHQRRTGWERRLDRLGDYLNQTRDDDQIKGDKS
jgi:hypothetical protein